MNCSMFNLSVPLFLLETNLPTDDVNYTLILHLITSYLGRSPRGKPGLSLALSMAGDLI